MIDRMMKIKSEIIQYTDSKKNIVFGVDGDFIKHSLITMMSILDKSNNEIFNFHIISSNINEDAKDNFKKLIMDSRHGLSFYYVDSDIFKNLRTTELFSRATYFRLLAPIILREEETLLYLDADIICLSPFDNLWKEAQQTADIALVVKEANGNHYSKIGLKENNYFNAGMMVINIKKWNDNNISENAFTILNESSQVLKYLDQDALNIALENKVSFINERYNKIFMLQHDRKGYSSDTPENTVFLHYAGADKPWQEWNNQYVCKHYREIYRKSPISFIPFDCPQDDQQAKKMYKSLMKKGKLLSSLFWRIKYYQLRYIK